MYAVMGATGQVGGAVVRTLRERGASVRAVARSAAKARDLFGDDVESVEADVRDADGLARAFAGASGVFVMNPPDYETGDMRETATQVIAAIREALDQAGRPPVVMLSSVGSQRQMDQGNIATTTILEQATTDVGALTTLRAAWFLENWAGALAVARDAGKLPSFLAPLDRSLPMVAASDIGSTAAALMLDGEAGRRLIELHGPVDYAPTDIALAAARVLGRPVQAMETPRDTWSEVLAGFGFGADSVANWIEMLDGFNSGWLDFEGGPGVERRQGTTTLDAFVEGVLSRG